MHTREKRYAGKSSQKKLNNYWNIIEEVAIARYKRMSYISFKHEKNQKLIFTFLLCNCMNLISYSIITPIFEFSMFIST
jgi:hypothetical protein